LILEGNYEEYLKPTPEEKIEKVLEVQELLAEKHQTTSSRVSLLLKLGNLLLSAKEYEEALTSYEQAIKVKPDYYQACYNKGIALSALGLKEEAITSYEKVLKIKPDYHQAWYAKGVSQSALERKERSLLSQLKLSAIYF
jgi:tetratricopeptide (TPR) repeat protein